MKKLIIAFVMVACATMANAAQIKWSANGIKTVSDSTKSAGSTYIALCFLGDSTDLAAKITALKAGTDISSLASTTKALSSGVLNTSYVDAGAGAGETANAYAIILDATTVAGAKNYMVLDTKSYTFGTASEQKTLSWGSQTGNTWQSIPEPTSAMLMLLGMAGLALRRRRA